VRYPLFPLAGAAAALLLGACTTPEAALKQRTEAIPDTQRAYIIGTLAVTCRPVKDICNPAYNAITAHYRSVDGAGVDGRLTYTWGSMFGGDTVADYTRQDRADKGSHFCIALPAGSYQFYAYDFIHFAGGGTGYRMSKDRWFNLPFTLAPGEVAYLGTIKLTSGVGENIFGWKMTAPGTMLLSSSPKEGIPAALKKCPESVRTRQVRDASLRATEALRPYVMADPQP
jgi:hypothetical protein